uniref:Uncharacterized protein n=1 Tax=Panagrolaimus sp. ES5 TaxID=591445 RepID=A0AC34FHD8_9BILA
MAVQEAGTRILHDLGILDSKVSSPHRTKPLEDGNFQQQTSNETKKTKDESTQRLIDDGNPIAMNNAPARQSDTFFKELMVYVFGLISIIAVWLLIADISHISIGLKINNIYQISLIPASLGVGIFIGSYLIIPLLLKVYALFVIQFFASFAVGVAVLQYNYLNFSSLLFAMGFLGIAFGVIERFSYLYIHRVLQNSKRKVIFFYAVLAFGLVFANLIVWNSTVLPMENVSNSGIHVRVKHDAGLPAINLSVYNPENRMTTETYRPTKPSSAIGISENQDTKTAENAEKRKLAEQKKESMTAALNATVDCHINPNFENSALNATVDCLINPNSENCTTTLIPTSTISSTTTSTTTIPITTPTVPTSTSTIAIKKDSIFDGSQSEPMFPSNPVDPIPRNRNRMDKVPSKSENLKSQKSDDTTSTTVEPTTPTFIASIIFILFLFPFNFAAFICNYFWSKETLLNGITISSLSILIALHQQATMNLSPYTTSGRYMLWSSMGRIFGPLIMGKILANDSLQMLANLIFIIIIMMLIAFYYFTKNVTTTARHQQLQDLTMDISSPQNNVTNSPINIGAASSSSITSTIKTRSTQYGTKYSLIDTDDTDSLSNCLISDSEEDELLSLRR